MIVKNGGDYLRNAIKSVSSFCSQIVVVDTGSVDDSPAVASSEGAELYFYRWNDDFSAARNHAISMVRTEWIIIIDADEEFTGSFKNIYPLLNNNSIGGINLPILNILDEKHTRKTHRYTRIFRNRNEIRFNGIIHEQVRPSIEEAGLAISESDEEIVHHGYNIKSTDRTDRNIRMLNTELKNKPDDHFSIFHLAQAEFAAGNTDQAYEHFNHIFDSSELSIPQNEMVKLRMAQINLNKNNIGNVRHLLDFVSCDINIEGFRKYILGAAALSLGEMDIAREMYNAAEVIQSELTDKNILSKVMSIID